MCGDTAENFCRQETKSRSLLRHSFISRRNETFVLDSHSGTITGDHLSGLFSTQDFMHLGGQVFFGKRLLNEIDIRIQHTVVGDDVCGAAAHEQALELGIESKYLFCQLAAVHLGHDHVGH